MAFLFVFIGGGVGSVFRYGISRMIPYTVGSFPMATLIANVVSSVILGILLGLSLRQSLSHNQEVLLITGFCGGFSTFSTFSGESLSLFEGGHLWMAVAYILISIVAGLMSVYLGMRIVGC